jgi:hypothetical protein
MSETNETCPHLNFVADVCVNRIEDTKPIRFNADVHVQCDDCGLPFRFIGLPSGVDLNGAAVNIDATEAHLAIAPKGEVVSVLEGAAIGFSVRKNDGQVVGEETEDGFGCRGLVPTREEQRHEKQLAALQQSLRERDEQLAAELQARTNAEFELLAMRDEVAKLKRPLTGEELRIDAADVELRSEMLADEGEELMVPLRDYNELSQNALKLDAEWREQLAAVRKERDEANRLRMQFIKDTVDDMECLPNCDEIGHDEMCPVCNEAEAWRLLRVRLEAAEMEVGRLRLGITAIVNQCQSVDVLTPLPGVAREFAADVARAVSALLAQPGEEAGDGDLS